MEKMEKTPITIEKFSTRFIGCCGAYCKTCNALENRTCKGCKLGYEEGERDISKAKCAIKVCCFRDQKLETCADCNRYSSCEILGGFYSKKGFKYKKYRETLEFIRDKGFSSFLKYAEEGKGPYGRLI